MKNYSSIFIRFTSIVFIFVIGSSASYAQTFKIATLSPDGSVWMKKMREGANVIEGKTEGRVKFKFYPGGVMGDDFSVLRKMRIKQLHGGAIAGGSLSRFYKDSQVYNLPLKFKTFEEVDYVRSQLDEKIKQGFEEGGIVTFGLAEGGFAYAMSKSPISSVSDLPKQKVWVPDNDKAALEIVRTYNIKPIPLPFADVLTGLQTGIIDTIATSPIAAVALQWHTQIKHITDIPLLYFYAVLAIDKKTFDKLSTDDQKTVRMVMEDIFKELDAINRKDNIAALEALKNRGIQVEKPAGETLQQWYTLAEAASQRLVDTGEISPETLQVFEQHLAEFRKKGSALTELQH